MRFNEVIEIGERLRRSTITELTPNELYRFIQKATNAINTDTIRRYSQILKRERYIEFVDNIWKIIKVDVKQDPKKDQPIENIEQKIKEIKQAKPIKTYKTLKPIKIETEEEKQKRKIAKQLEINRLIENATKEKRINPRKTLDEQNKIIYQEEVICESCFYDMTGQIWRGYSANGIKISEEDFDKALRKKFCDSCGKLLASVIE